MKIVRDPRKMQEIIAGLKLKKKAVGLVPTMGALHAGHLSLIQRCCRDNQASVVSIFVNPSQFSPKEDLRKYPRPIKKDFALCKKAGVDLLFYPAAADIYPAGFKTYVSVEGLSDLLCGKSRPGHFRGVATIVAKLFNIVNPDNAYFGQKDAQQALIIRQMAADLNFPVQVHILPTIRAENGLALSSRNAYLNKKERKDALVLAQALSLAKAMFCSGVRDAGKIIAVMKRLITSVPGARIDYLEAVGLTDLKPVKRISGSCLVAMAVRIGKTRLIDNVIICLKN
jgi:pantoate--beta-alanine ligase